MGERTRGTRSAPGCERLRAPSRRERARLKSETSGRGLRMTIRWQNDIERKAGSRTAWLDFLTQSTAWLLFLGPLEIRLARNLKGIRAIWSPTRHQWSLSSFHTTRESPLRRNR